MPSIGDKLGPYEIVGPLGKGGMGEVYRARDAKLNRDVAIKVLPTALAKDADYLARFQREAQTLAALNHPNIATIYGLEQDAIVMELVEGATLQTPQPFDDALKIAKQIAEALEAAHDKGIIHRDLKPGNVKVTPEGVVKVLDFGLAKAVERPTETGPDSPTLTMRATEAGLILGTAAYMSPEQAAGKSVDRRADIWSFGVVLYEMLTGKRLFDGETVTHTLADVVRAPIDFDVIPAGPIRELVRRCLDRNLRNRLSHIGEARYILENPVSEPVVKAADRRPWIAAAVCAVAAVAGWGLWLRKPAEVQTPVAFEVNAPPDRRFASINSMGGSAISPDGKTLAYVLANEQQELELHVRPIGSVESRALPGTQGAGRPFWSPDSKSIGFFANGKLKRVDLSAGSPVTLCDASGARGGSWNAEGVIIFGQQGKGIHRIAASGGTPTEITKFSGGDVVSHYYPQFLPGGKRFLFLILDRMNAENSGMFVSTLDGQAPARVVQTRYRAHLDAVSGRLFYVHGDSTLMERRIDQDSLAFTGEPSLVAEGIRSIAANGYSDFSVSDSGDVFYSLGPAEQLRHFVWRDRGGKQLGPAGPQGSQINPQLAPDGRKVAYWSFAAGAAAAELRVLDLERQVSTRIASGGNIRRDVSWSLDGKHVYDGNSDGIRRIAADGSGTYETLATAKRVNRVGDPTRDGKFLWFTDVRTMLMPLTGEHKPVPFGSEADRGVGQRSSPDGRWVAYAAGQFGSFDVFLRGYPDDHGKWQVSSTQVTGRISWRADGRELFFQDAVGKRTVRSVSVEPQPASVRVGKPDPLFDSEGDFVGVTPDSRRFLMDEPVGVATEKTRMIVLRNRPKP